MFCTTFVDMNRFSLGNYDVTELFSTDENSDGKFEVLLLGASPGALYGLEFGYTKGTELRLYNGRDIGITLVTYDGTELCL